MTCILILHCYYQSSIREIPLVNVYLYSLYTLPTQGKLMTQFLICQNQLAAASIFSSQLQQTYIVNVFPLDAAAFCSSQWLGILMSPLTHQGPLSISYYFRFLLIKQGKLT